MRTTLKKLRGGIAAFKHDRKNKRRHRQPMHQLDELSQAHKDMQDMRDCYDRLLSAAAAAENSAFEFSESLGEIGDCLLEKIALSDFDDEESSRVLLMLGKVQFEIQRLVDTYRSHISRTITVPSESLTNELRVVEEMKKQCDGKREAYEDLLKKNREKGRLRSARVYFSSHHLKIARDEYDEEANAVIFRMRSLKQGQCRSLLTQAARHHAAQLSFFRKAFQSLEAIEPPVKSVTNEQHIDYQFTGLDDDESDDFSECIADDGPLDGSELSFDYRQDVQRQDAILKESLEEEGSPGSNSFAFQKVVKTTSNSAPLFADAKLDPTSRPAELRPSPSHKYTSYVLPMPPEAKSPVSEVKSPVSGKAVTGDSETTGARFETLNLWHSSPLDQNKYEQSVTSEVLSGSMLDTKSVLRDSNHNTKACPLPPPLTECFIYPTDVSDAQELKRQAFSGPLERKPLENNPAITASGPIDSTGYPPPLGSILCSTPSTQPLSTRILCLRPSPTFILSPNISELHELPRPPPHLVSKTPTTQVGYSGPLTTKDQELYATYKLAVLAATTLRRPPSVIPRSYSIPSRGRAQMALYAWKPLPASHNLQIHDEICSPHLAPISLANIQPASPDS